jgi:hypothetical protein
MASHVKWSGVGVLAVCAGLAFAGQASAGVGCDINVRVNNKLNRSITVYGWPESSASKAGLNVWSPLDKMVNASLDAEGSGSGSHTKQAVELELPCWTGKVDFRIKYLDGTSEAWTRRNGVTVSSGTTVQINIP